MIRILKYFEVQYGIQIIVVTWVTYALERLWHKPALLLRGCLRMLDTMIRVYKFVSHNGHFP